MSDRRFSHKIVETVSWELSRRSLLGRGLILGAGALFGGLGLRGLPDSVLAVACGEPTPPPGCIMCGPSSCACWSTVTTCVFGCNHPQNGVPCNDQCCNGTDTCTGTEAWVICCPEGTFDQGCSPCSCC
jgi:hypothetical protein